MKYRPVGWAVGLWVTGLILAFWVNQLGVKTAITIKKVPEMAIEFSFWKLFFFLFGNNVLACTLLIVGGLTSAGLLSAAGLVWNGFLLGVIVCDGIATGIKTTKLLSALLIHGPIELTAFLWAGSLGLRGLNLASNLYREGRIRPEHWPSCSELLVPFILLAVSAALETIVILWQGV